MTETLEATPERVLVLGPQGHGPNVVQAVERLGLDGPLATVTAGWEEREGEDAELAEALGGRTRNLGLWPRAEEVFQADPSVREVLYERYDRLRELQGLYRLRLAGQLEACRQLLGATDPADPDPLHAPAIEHAIAGVQALDAHHLERARALDAEIAERLDVAGRPSLARHRDELRALVEPCEALLVAGGHVGILLNRLRLFDVLGLWGQRPIVAWSGGAMVLGERIVLFHDSPPQGPGDAEVYAPGLGLVRGLLTLPHSRHRLRLDDPARVALFARRFAPDRCVCLDGAELLEGRAREDAWGGDPVRILRPGGAVEEGPLA